MSSIGSVELKSRTKFDLGWLLLLHFLLTADNSCYILATGTMLVALSGFSCPFSMQLPVVDPAKHIVLFIRQCWYFHGFLSCCTNLSFFLLLSKFDSANVTVVAVAALQEVVRKGDDQISALPSHEKWNEALIKNKKGSGVVCLMFLRKLFVLLVCFLT